MILILNVEMIHVFGVLLPIFEPRSTVSGIDGDEDVQGHHQKPFDESIWKI